MEHINASDAKREFGAVILKAQQEPISIKRNGTPVAVMISASEYHKMEEIKQSYLRFELAKGMESLKKNRVTDGKTVMKRLRALVDNA